MRRLSRDERGSQVLEFALVFPVFAFLIFGLIFLLMAAGAYVSLTHGALEGVRFASIPTDPIAGTYPTNAAVATRVRAASPFFFGGGCTTTVTGATAENQPVSVSVTCQYFNPLGGVVNGLGSMLARMAGASNAGGTVSGGNLNVSVTATSRHE